METITFHCKVITPMFLSGADGHTPELRAPSIKGALRFWWRALNGHLVEQNGEKDWNYSKLKDKEGKIFGDTGQRSSFSIQLEWENRMEGELPLPETEIPDGNFNNDIFKFMTYGLSTNQKYIGPGSTFICKLRIFNSEYNPDILKSFYSLIHFGGIGAKARNGFGGIDVSGSPILESFNVDAKAFVISPRDYSCFSEKTEQYSICTNEGAWNSALAKVLLDYVDHKNEFGKEEKNYIAAHTPSALKLERKPKFCFYKVNKNTAGRFTGSVLFMPYLLPKHEDKHSSILQSFIDKTINS